MDYEYFVCYNIVDKELALNCRIFVNISKQGVDKVMFMLHTLASKQGMTASSQENIYIIKRTLWVYHIP